MRSAYLAIDVVIAIGLLSLAGVSLLRQGYKNSINRLFTLLSIFVAFWIVANNISNDISMPNTVAIFCDYIVFSASFGSYIILTQFVIKFASIDKLERTLSRILIF